MDWLPPVLGAIAAALAGAVLAGEQWRLYSEPEYRAEPLSGRRLLLYRGGFAVAAGATALLALRPDHYDLAPALLTAAWCLVLVLVSSTDFERRRIPNLVTYPAVPIALALSWAWPDRGVLDVFIGFGVAIGIAVVLFVLGLAVGALLRVRATPFGLGDVKLIILIGALAAFPAVFSALFLGVLLAGIPSVVMIAMGRRRATFSYGPYLAAGALVVLLFPDRFV